MFNVGDRVVCDYAGNRFNGHTGTVRALRGEPWVRVTWDDPIFQDDDGGIWSDTYIRVIDDLVEPEDWS